MPIYHFEAKVISRGTGRSAVAASAYMSCSKILSDYDGVQHDYTRKQGLVWQRVFLPEYAPAKWKDRSVLWNAVEEKEKTKDSRLAREFVAALPIELNKSEWIDMLTDFIKSNFVADGMCADVAIHDTDGHNPCAHITTLENLRARLIILMYQPGMKAGFVANRTLQSNKALKLAFRLPSARTTASVGSKSFNCVVVRLIARPLGQNPAFIGVLRTPRYKCLCIIIFFQIFLSIFPPTRLGSLIWIRDILSQEALPFESIFLCVLFALFGGRASRLLQGGAWLEEVFYHFRSYKLLWY